MYLDFGSLIGILLLLALAGIAWFWNDSLRARDQVIQACRRLCAEIEVQLLDETVALRQLRLQRGERGGWQAARRYTFEYSRTGADRWPGHALLSGPRLESVQLQGPDGVIILNPARAAPQSGFSVISGEDDARNRREL